MCEISMDENNIMPAIPLRELCVFPNAIIHFDLSRVKSIETLEKAMTIEQKLFLVAYKDSDSTEPKMDDLYEIGVVANVKQIIKMPNKIIRVLVEGKKRAKLLSIETGDTYMAKVKLLDEEVSEDEMTANDNAKEAMKRQILEMYQLYLAVTKKNDKGIIKHLKSIGKLGDLLDAIASMTNISFEKKQMLLNEYKLQRRFSVMAAILQEEMDVESIKNELSKEVKKQVDKNQKDYILREQMKYIRKELGEDNTESEIDSFRERLANLNASQEIKTRINKEINRLQNLGHSSSESAVERTYIETLLDMPWNKESEDNTDIIYAEQVLQKDHYGMGKIKERILEYLAVRKLADGNKKSAIICLVGPPGTGKTSIAKSMAKAMNREYVRICLGGVRDEAEIRGHRKTYVGAMPGRIANAIKQAGVKNPLILLDEIDKMGNDRRGDTASAMLEVLDGEQNEHFQDHYLEVGLDLSDVVFVATANDISNLEGPLRDRMEIIEVSSYTSVEKFHIAKEHLVKKQLKDHGISKKQLSITDKALDKIISSYTREAGVRNLERQIGKICRKVAMEIVRDEDVRIKVSAKNLAEYLGKEKYQPEKINKNSQVGIVRGLAWTAVGGVTLEVEVNNTPGKGELKLTGQLGDVMKESAMTALSYVKFVSGDYGIEENYFDKHDIHIHIPEGATPKDGPSAGITMSTAILSAVTDKKVRADVAMTGEVTLRGRVLPIGGLKEKLLAAKQIGVKTVCIPEDNTADLSEIDGEIKTGLNIVPVCKMADVIKVAFDE